MTLHSSMIFKVFQLTSLPRFGYISSPKKGSEMFNNIGRKSLECIWQTVHKCTYPHNEEKQHSHNPLLKWASKKDTFNNLLTFPIFRTLKCAFPISAFFWPIPCDIPDTDKNVEKSCLYK